MKRSSVRQRGISLIEALVAMAVMAFGMLGIVGLQATLRTNSDVSKQRSEAVRIAQATIEAQRAYSVLNAASAASAAVGYDQIASAAEAAASAANANTAFLRTVTVTNYPEPGDEDLVARRKEVVVALRWQDRTDAEQSVRLSTVVAGIEPEMTAALSTPAEGSMVQRPFGRHPTIPPMAKNLPGGISVFKPPQGPAGGTVAWVFDNNTGLLKSCTVDIASTTETLGLADLADACVAAAFNAQLLSGYVRFAALGAAPTEAEAEFPTGTSLNLNIELVLTTVHPAPDPGWVCFDDASPDAVDAGFRNAVAYYCAINMNASGRWAGRSRIVPLGFVTPAATADWVIALPPVPIGSTYYKVCRYTRLGADSGPDNVDHPLDYTSAGSPARGGLANQNFLVVNATHACPADVADVNDLVNSNTRDHQTGAVHYESPPVVPTPF